jgi:Predicted signal transduction protein with a C-terminal ATPase domain
VRIASFLNNLKIRKKLLVIYFIAGVLPMFCLGVFLIASTRNLVVKQYNTQIEAENKRVKLILFDVTYLATNTSQLIFYDRQLKEIITVKYTDNTKVYAAYRDYPVLDTYLKNYTEISGITLYVNNETMVTSGRFKVADYEVKKTEWYKQAAKSSGEIIWVVNSDLAKDGNLHLVRKIPLSDSSSFAVMVISISNNFLKLLVNDSPLQTIAALDYRNIFFSDNYAEIYKPMKIDVEKEYPLPPQLGSAKYDGREVLVSSSVLKPVNANNVLQIVTLDKDAFKNINEATLIISIVVFISLIVPYFVIIIFSNLFSRRVITLRSEMHKIAGGDLNIIDDFNGSDELGDLFADMKLTIKDINDLYKEIYNEKLAREKLINIQQKMEFEMLCSQINPHFLYNTLETIRMKAFNNGEKEVAHFIKLLGKSMRHVLEVRNGMVTLSSELMYIGIYMDIQVFRFGDKIKYSINVDDNVNADNYYILPLLLQPVVENSIIHGLEDREFDGRIDINIEYVAEVLVITISDNGAGMSESRYHALSESINNIKNVQSKSSIGLHNVQQRIKLFYGAAYGIEIRSRQDAGTTVVIRLPSDGRDTVFNEGSDN